MNRRFVRPMQIFKNQQQRLLRRQLFERRTQVAGKPLILRTIDLPGCTPQPREPCRSHSRQDIHAFSPSADEQSWLSASITG